MDKWEYKIFIPEMKGWFTKKVSSTTPQELDALGKEGWELVSVTPEIASTGGSWAKAEGSFVFFFKRKIS